MSFTIFMDSDTLCNREGNRCKRREKCQRYMKTQGENDWVADYWQEFGKFCDGFIPMKEKTNADTASVRKGKECGSGKADDSD